MKLQIASKLQMDSIETKVWIFLMLITGVSWMLGANHGVFLEGIAIESSLLMLLAFYKVRLIMQYFMEVRKASFLLRLGCDAWMLGSVVAIVIFCIRLA